MARVEASSPTPVAPPPRRWHMPIPKFSLGRLIKLALLVGIVWVVVLVARTGLWNIPFVSAATYTRPEPLERITGTFDVEQVLQERAAGFISGSMQISDSELTALAQVGSQKLHLGLAEVNVVALANQPLELSFSIPKRNNAVVRIDLVPVIHDGQLDFTVTRTRVGAVAVPDWTIGQATRVLLATQLRPLFAGARLESVTTADHQLRLTYATP